MTNRAPEKSTPNPPPSRADYRALLEGIHWLESLKVTSSQADRTTGELQGGQEIIAISFVDTIADTKLEDVPLKDLAKALIVNTDPECWANFLTLLASQLAHFTSSASDNSPFPEHLAPPEPTLAVTKEMLTFEDGYPKASAAEPTSDSRIPVDFLIMLTAKLAERE